MALKKVKGSIDRMFDKSLQDLVRGIRNHKGNESQYISQCIDDIKHELKQGNIAIKSNAVLKLIYLQMLGYDISWAAFNIIEVMSAQKFTFKRIGYFASAQSFHVDTDVLMLTTNMIRKDLGSMNMYDTSVALNGLSCFMTSDLARDLVNDIMSLMASIKPYVRKRAVLISYKIFLAYPEALRPAFPRLKEKLEDPDQGVQSAAVNVICELARKNPRNYLSLAPLFFKLMTTSTNNWVLIKIIKLFGSLTPLEPRLGKKLIEPLTNLIHSTSAMSLLYECINTVIQGMTEHNASIQLCVQKLRILIEDSDQNLKYLGLLAMSRILKSHPKAVQAHKDLVLQCLDDKDESIRLRALDLLFGMVSKKNLMEIVKKLMTHLQRAEGSQYRDELLVKIIEICSQQNYQYITNFEWYISVLVELTRIDGATHHGSLISSQLLDVAVRVKSIRSFAANQMATLLENSHAIITQLQRNGMHEALYAAAYICGEYCMYINDISSVIKSMLRPRTATLTEHIQSIYIQNIMKMYAVAIRRLEDEEEFEEAKALTTSLQEQLQFMVKSGFLEVQERASSASTILKYLEKVQSKGVAIADEVALLFYGELNPVAPKAQKKVPVPQGLDLDEWINHPPSESSEDEVEVGTFTKTASSLQDFYGEEKKRAVQLTPEEISAKREQRLMEQANNPNYLLSSLQKKKTANGYQNPDSPMLDDLPPIADLDISVPLHVPGLTSSDKYLRQDRERRRELETKKSKHRKDKKRRRGKKGRLEESEDETYDVEPLHKVDIVQEEMPEGAVQSDSDEDKRSANPYRALDIDLDTPLTNEDRLPVPTHHVSASPSKDELKIEETTEKKKSKKKKKEKKKKERKSRKHEHKQENLLAEEALSNGDAQIINSKQEPVAMETQHKPAQKETDDFSFWLSQSQTNGTTVAIDKPDVMVDESATTADADAAGDKASKKKSREKKHKRKHKKHHKEEEEVVNQVLKEEERPSTPPLNDLTRYVMLGTNDHLMVQYELRSTASNQQQFVVSCVFANKTDKNIKNIDFNVLDTLNTKLIRGSGNLYDAVRIPFVLLPSSRNESQLQLTAASVNMPQKLKGTITYILKDEDGSSQHKLDFQLHLPCSTYLTTQKCSSDSFTQLLASGNVNEKASIKVKVEPDVKFTHVIQKICFYLKFTVIERVDDSASLYSASIQQHPICLLVKRNANFIAVDAKSSDSKLLTNLMDEVKNVINK